MSNARLNAIAAVTNYEATGAALDFSKTPATDLFGSNVFNDKVMQERLPSAVYKAVRPPIMDVELSALGLENTDCRSIHF